MRLKLFLLPLLALAARPVCAQATSPQISRPSSAVEQLTAQATPLDTAAALHRLFEHGRHRLRLALPLTLAVGGGLTALSATSNPPTNDPLTAGFNGFLTGLAGVATTVFVVAELGQHGRYSPRREQRALAQWQAHQLPAKLRRRLAPRFFTAPAQ